MNINIVVAFFQWNVKEIFRRPNRGENLWAWISGDTSHNALHRRVMLKARNGMALRAEKQLVNV